MNMRYMGIAWANSGENTVLSSPLLKWSYSDSTYFTYSDSFSERVAYSVKTLLTLDRYD